MRKNYFYLLFLFLSTTISFAQKVTITPTSVNGSNVNAGPINLASVPYSSISLGIKVEIPDGASVGDQGTIKIYYMNSVALGSNVAIGGDGGALYFGGGKVATRSFTINLNWADFQTSGGFIYAEYKNGNSPSGAAFKSAYLSVIKNATMTTGTNLNPPADAPNPTKIPNTLCCDQIVRVGEKPAIITGSTYLNPYQGEPYGINSTWIANGLGSVRFISNDRSTLEIDYLTETGKFTVTRGLGYNHGGQYPNKSNAITITVVQTPILRNTISASGSINSEGFIELSSLKNLNIFGMGSVVNLKVLQDPFYTIQPRDPGVSVDSYKWEYTKTNTNQSGPKTWTTISNENSENLDFYDPSEKSNLEDTYYLVRRIAIYQNISNASEPIKIVVRGLRYNNTICCDQILKISSLTNYETPSTIIGSTPTVDNPNIDDKDFSILGIGYQWQSQIQERGLSVWTDIPGATSKDYLLAPSSLKVISGNGRRGSPAFVFESSYNYRRIARINYQTFYPKWINTTVTSYSNEVSLTGSSNEAYMKIYPNPTSSILNIESTSDISDAKVTISNIIGNIVNSNNYSVVNPKLISINVTGLTVGTYFITIDSQSFGTTQKTFIKQ